MPAPTAAPVPAPRPPDSAAPITAPGMAPTTPASSAPAPACSRIRRARRRRERSQNGGSPSVAPFEFRAPTPDPAARYARLPQPCAPRTIAHLVLRRLPMARKRVKYFFAFVSPFAALADARIDDVVTGAGADLVPIPLVPPQIGGPLTG